MSSRRRSIAVAVAVLLIAAAGSLLALSRLDLSTDAASKGAKRPSTSAPTSSTRRITTTTTQAPLRKATTYTVLEGDTLSGIAKRFEVTTGAIVLANKLTDPDRLTVGQVLIIPPPVPVHLVVKPAPVPPGGNVRLTLSGATPGEKVTFQIATPTGSFTGPVHVASPDGIVTTTYTPGVADLPGSYLVVARGDQGTTAQAALVVGNA
ncbi:MAG TPA: LysM domain-containing protein [Nocardioidaceae bacterium]|nr:LysM domain-containing protein [Nocardioidaceae bacterium]